MDNRFPEVLHGQPLGFVGILSHEFALMLIWLLPAGCVFLLTVWALMIYKALGGRVSLDIALKAALRVGVAAYLFLPLFQLPFFILENQNAAAVTGLCLVGLILATGIAAALRLIRRARSAAMAEKELSLPS